MYKSMKINGDHTLLEEFKKYRNQLNNSLKNAEKLYYREQLNNNRDNLSKTWKTLNKIISKRKTNQRSITFMNNDKKISDQDVADHFNN